MDTTVAVSLAEVLRAADTGPKVRKQERTMSAHIARAQATGSTLTHHVCAINTAGIPIQDGSQ